MPRIIAHFFLGLLASFSTERLRGHSLILLFYFCKLCLYHLRSRKMMQEDARRHAGGKQAAKLAAAHPPPHQPHV